MPIFTQLKASICWASAMAPNAHQSSVIASRPWLEQRYAEVEAREGDTPAGTRVKVTGTRDTVLIVAAD